MCTFLCPFIDLLVVEMLPVILLYLQLILVNLFLHSEIGRSLPPFPKVVVKLFLIFIRLDGNLLLLSASGWQYYVFAEAERIEWIAQ